MQPQQLFQAQRGGYCPRPGTHSSPGGRYCPRSGTHSSSGGRYCPRPGTQSSPGGGVDTVLSQVPIHLLEEG